MRRLIDAVALDERMYHDVFETDKVKEAIETLEANYPDACYEQLRDAVDVALAVLKQMAEWRIR